MARIFISYRRSDASGYAGLLFEHLEKHYPGEIFLDRNMLEDGARWDQEIAAHLDSCEALLVVIGPNWHAVQDEKSRKRKLDNPKDWVRREVQTVLKRKVRVIPVLMGGAQPLSKDHDLPRTLRALESIEARVVRDRSIVADLSSLAQYLNSAIGAPKSADPAKYLDQLRRETEFIDIRGLQVSGQKARRFRIDELYTPLTTVLADHSEEKGARLERRATPLVEALRKPRVVLVGDPGAGKSTFLRRIAFAACQPRPQIEFLGGNDARFPLLIQASGLANFMDERKPADWDSPEWLSLYLESKSRANHWDLTADFFTSQLNAGCLLLVDGLDEAPDRTHRKRLARLLEKAAVLYEQSRIVVTSRPSAYGGETSMEGFETVTIAPLDPEAVDTFVRNWCAALYPGDPSGAEQHRAELEEAIHSRPEIEALGSNPVMLTALTVLHWNEKRLPDQRADLYDSIITWLARAKEMNPRRAPAERCLALLQHLAYTMHAHPKGMQVEIAPHAAAQALAARFRDIPADDRMAAAEQFLQDEEIDSGIIAGRDRKLRFWHRTFQEYLAAKALAGREEDRQRLLFKEGKLYLPEWRETVLLLGGVLCKQDTERIDAFLSQMLDGADGGSLAVRARCVGLIGRILRDLKAWNYEIADPRYRRNLDSVLEIFDAGAVRRIDFQTRLEAADALGQAGDPRLDPNNARDNWVRVPGGLFWMGAQNTDPNGKNYDPDAYDDEAPVRWVHVPSFEMGRYPVTVAEYDRFIESGGYKKDGFWTAGGYAQFSEPENWQRQLQYPNRPVVEVSWYEAAAYCKWNGGRLPTEAQWEYAARAGRESVRYPWGNEDPDEYRANFHYDQGPKQPTPVGLYPEGATPGALLDMSGNVFDWVEDTWDEGKAFRGGSWSYGAQDLRVSSRGGNGPGARLSDVGFRCVRELLSL